MQNDDRLVVKPAVRARVEGVTAAVLQAQTMLQNLGPNGGRKLVLMPNARPGTGFTPLQGYALEMAPDAPFVVGDYNTQQFFRGHAVLPLIPDAMKDKLPCNAGLLRDKWASLSACEALKLYEASAAEALKNVNGCTDLMALQDADHSGGSSPDMACVMIDAGSQMAFLAVTSHRLPTHEALGNMDIGTYLRVQAKDGLTVRQALLPGHPVGNTMARYYKSQRTFREIVARNMRHKLLHHFFPDADVSHLHQCDAAIVCDKNEAVHMVTNMADLVANGAAVRYYSDAVRATRAAGAIVSAGPFKQSLWVNVPQATVETTACRPRDVPPSATAGDIRAADMLDAVPFHVPTEHLQFTETLQRIAEMRNKQTVCKNRDRFADVICSGEEAGKTHLSHAIVKHHSQSHSRAFGGSAGGGCQTTCGEIGDLIWRHYAHYARPTCCPQPKDGCDYPGQQQEEIKRPPAHTVETYSPYEHLGFVHGFENEATRQGMAELGVNLNSSAPGHAYLIPLFCISSPQPVRASLTAAHLANFC